MNDQFLLYFHRPIIWSPERACTDFTVSLTGFMCTSEVYDFSQYVKPELLNIFV